MILTPREGQVLELVIQGYESAEIAEQLGIQLRTVKAHLGKLYRHHAIRSSVKRVALAVAYTQPKTALIRLPHLSVKKVAILEQVALARSNKEIAAHFGTTDQCVKNVLRDIYDATGSSNRVELAIWAVRVGLHDPQAEFEQPELVGIS